MKVTYKPLALRLIQHLALSLTDNRETQRIETLMYHVPKAVLAEVHVWAILNGCSVGIDRTKADLHDGCRYLIYTITNENECEIGVFFSERY